MEPLGRPYKGLHGSPHAICGRPQHEMWMPTRTQMDAHIKRASWKPTRNKWTSTMRNVDAHPPMRPLWHKKNSYHKVGVSCPCLGVQEMTFRSFQRYCKAMLCRISSVKFIDILFNRLVLRTFKVLKTKFYGNVVNTI